MKHLLFALFAVLLICSMASAQTDKGTSKMTSGVDQSVSGMRGGPHDFTSHAADSLAVGGKLIGPTEFLCGYCHVPHVTKTGVTGPLWARKSLSSGTTHAGITFGRYESATMDAAPADVNGVGDDNYSSFCLTCHDGSQMFASAAYASKPVPNGTQWPDSSTPTGIAFGNAAFGATSATQSYMQMSTTGSYGGLNHIHPVNIVYQASSPGLWPLGPTGTYAYMDPTYGAVGRVFNNKVQCSSCHNPHINEENAPKTGGSYPLIEGTLNGGALCVACHKK